jgi:hypothetical protein
MDDKCIERHRHPMASLGSGSGGEGRHVVATGSTREIEVKRKNQFGISDKNIKTQYI